MSIEGHIDREGVVALLGTQPDFRVLGSAGTSGETMELCLELHPPVLVLGILDGWPRDISAVQAVRLVSPKTQILVLAPHSPNRCAHLNPADPPGFDAGCSAWLARSTCLQDALSRGALGAVHRDISPTALFQAVRAVATGEHRVTSEVTRLAGNGHPLSPQELKVARLIGHGSSNKEISTSLGISELTVKKHVGSILHRLGLHDRLQLGICVARHPLAFNGD